MRPWETSWMLATAVALPSRCTWPPAAGAPAGAALDRPGLLRPTIPPPSTKHHVPGVGLPAGVVSAGLFWFQPADVDGLPSAGAFAIGVDQQDSLQSVGQPDQADEQRSRRHPTPCLGGEES